MSKIEKQIVSVKPRNPNQYDITIDGRVILCTKANLEDFQIPILEGDERQFGVFAHYTPKQGKTFLQFLCFCTSIESTILEIPRVENLLLPTTDHGDDEQGDIPLVLRNFCSEKTNSFTGFKTERLIEELKLLSVSFHKIFDAKTLGSKKKYNYDALLKDLVKGQLVYPSSSVEGATEATLVAKAYYALKMYATAKNPLRVD